MTEAFAHASNMIAQSLGPEVDQQIMKYMHTVQIDNQTQFVLFPASNDYFPLGLMIQGFDNANDLASEKPVGLFADWSYALCSMRGVLALHNKPVETATEHMVMHDSVQVGDLIGDLGFTITSLDRFTDHVRLYDGDGQQVLIKAGSEFKVLRNWEGYSSFVAEAQVVSNG